MVPMHCRPYHDEVLMAFTLPMLGFKMMVLSHLCEQIICTLEIVKRLYGFRTVLPEIPTDL